MKKLMVAIAGAVALTCSAFAEEYKTVDWFNGGVTNGFPNAATMFGGAWSNTTDQAEWVEEKVVIAADEATPLAFNADVAVAADNTYYYTNNVIVEAQIKFTPFTLTSGDDLPAVPEGAEVGLILVKWTSDEGYCYYYIDDGEWELGYTEYPTSINPEEFVTVKIVQDANQGSVEYFIDGVSLGYGSDLDDVGALSTANFTGDGEIKSLGASYELLMYEFTVNQPDNLDVIAVTNNGVEITAPYKVAAESEVIVTYKTKPGYVFADGTDTKQGVATVDNDGVKITTDVEDEEVKQANADINGTKWYLTFNDAAAAAADNDVITLSNNLTTVGAAAIAAQNVTLDLAGYTLTVTNGFQVNDTPANCSLTIKDGKICTTEAAKRSYLIRTYGKALTLDNVELDATYLVEPDPTQYEADPDLYTGAILAPSGDVILEGESSIVNVPAGLYAIAFDNYAGSSYTMGTLDFGTATVSGNILITGGKVANADTATFAEDTKFFIGAAASSYCTADTLKDSGLVAMTGAFPAGKAPSKPSYQINITGEAFLGLDKAIAAVEAGDTVTLLADVAAAVDYTGAVDFTFDLNGKLLTDSTADATLKNNGTGTITVEDSVGTGKIYNGSDANGYGIAVYSRLGAIVVNGGNFENNTKYEATATAGHAALTINGGTFKNLCTDAYEWKKEWSKLALNRVNSWEGVLTVTGGTFSSDPAQGDDKLGGTFVADGYYSVKGDTLWTVTNTGVAAAIGDKGYLTLADAIDAVKADDTVTLLADIESAVDYTGTVDFTFDLNGKLLTDSTADATLKNNGTGTITVEDSVGTGKIYNGSNADGYGIAVYSRLGVIVVNGGNFENNTKYEATATAGHAALTINGGTFKNLCTDAYEWKKEWSKLALNRVNSWEGVLTVTGGSFSSDPAQGDDKLGGTFVAEGYESKLNGTTGLYDVAEKQGGTVAPGGSPVPVTADTKEEAEAQVTVSATAPEGSGITDEQYSAYFKAEASSTGANTWNVSAVLDETKVEVADTTAEVGAKLSDFASGTATSLEITDAKPGLYYSVEYTGDVGTAADQWDEGDRTMATGAGVTIDMPKAEGGATFYKVLVNTTDKGQVQ